MLRRLLVGLAIAGLCAIAVAGAGVAARPSAGVVASPDRVNFGRVAVGTYPFPSATITYTNNTDVYVERHSYNIGSNGWMWDVVAGCPTSIAPGGTCSVTVEYWPISAGRSTTTLSVSWDRSDGGTVIETAVPLSANAYQPK